MIKTTYTLEMSEPGQLRPKLLELPGLRIERVRTPCPEYNKFLHVVVGAPWRWGGRSDWGEKQWRAHVGRDELETWVMYRDGTPAGYFELERNPAGDAQILVFGLLPQFVGQGLGGHLLTKAVQRAFASGANRVWLQTCSHDHPHALKNYQARGFRLTAKSQGPANRRKKSFWELG
jgi:ribosomal protein S18 acetylase RimI-like enzyme